MIFRLNYFRQFQSSNSYAPILLIRKLCLFLIGFMLLYSLQINAGLKNYIYPIYELTKLGSKRPSLDKLIAGRSLSKKEYNHIKQYTQEMIVGDKNALALSGDRIVVPYQNNVYIITKKTDNKYEISAIEVPKGIDPEDVIVHVNKNEDKIEILAQQAKRKYSYSSESYELTDVSWTYNTRGSRVDVTIDTHSNGKKSLVIDHRPTAYFHEQAKITSDPGDIIQGISLKDKISPKDKANEFITIKVLKTSGREDRLKIKEFKTIKDEKPPGVSPLKTEFQFNQ